MTRALRLLLLFLGAILLFTGLQRIGSHDTTALRYYESLSIHFKKAAKEEQNQEHQQLKLLSPDTQPFAVRDYYPQKIKVPSWIEDYVDFHNNAVIVDKNTNRARLKEGTKFLVYKCQGLCGGLGDRTNGMVTLFYAALLSRRVLIIDHPTPFPLVNVLLPHRIRWDVDNYPNPDKQYNIIDRFGRPIDFLKEPCQTDADALGILIRVNQWYMKYLWPGECMQTMLRTASSSSSRANTTTVEKATEATSSSTPPQVNFDKDRQHTYRWAFWTMFQFHKDVLEEADRLRNEAGLTQESTTTTHNDAARANATTNMANSNYVRFRPYISIHGRHDRHRGDGKERMFLDCAHKFQTKIRNLQKEINTNVAPPRDIVVISDRSSFKEHLHSWDNATVKVSKTDEYHTDRARTNNNEKGNLDVFAELAILMDSECLVRSRSGYSELPQMVTISNEVTLEPCGVQFDECRDEDVDSAINSLFWSDKVGILHGNSTWNSRVTTYD